MYVATESDTLIWTAAFCRMGSWYDIAIDWDWWTLACCHYDGTVSPKLIAAEIAESCAYGAADAGL